MRWRTSKKGMGSNYPPDRVTEWRSRACEAGNSVSVQVRFWFGFGRERRVLGGECFDVGLGKEGWLGIRVVCAGRGGGSVIVPWLWTDRG